MYGWRASFKSKRAVSCLRKLTLRTVMIQNHGLKWMPYWMNTKYPHHPHKHHLLRHRCHRLHQSVDNSVSLSKTTRTVFGTFRKLLAFYKLFILGCSIILLKSWSCLSECWWVLHALSVFTVTWEAVRGTFTFSCMQIFSFLMVTLKGMAPTHFTAMIERLTNGNRIHFLTSFVSF